MNYLALPLKEKKNLIEGETLRNKNVFRLLSLLTLGKKNLLKRNPFF